MGKKIKENYIVQQFDKKSRQWLDVQSFGRHSYPHSQADCETEACYVYNIWDLDTRVIKIEETVVKDFIRE